MKVTDFEFTVEYKKGALNTISDALSRTFISMPETQEICKIIETNPAKSAD